MDRTCATCLWYCRDPGTNRNGCGVCFRRHVYDGYGWTTADKTCSLYCVRRYARQDTGGYCVQCTGPVDESDRYCRHCGIEFTRGKR